MSTLAAVAEAARWAIGLLLLWRLPPLGDADEAGPVACSVVVPARDEAANLGRLLPSLAGQAGEVIVVDDGSSDGTSDVASRLGATTVAAGALRAGWLGKPWACARGASLARYDTIVFLDADVVVEPGGVQRLVAELDRHGGIVSVQPWHDVRRPYEKLSAFPNLIAAMGTGGFTVAGRRARPRAAFGPCLAVHRSTYDLIGGHGAVRSQVAEDVALGRLAPHLALFGGRGSFRYRMYPEGPMSLWRGWTKNLAAGASATHPVVLALVVAWVSGLVQAPFAGPLRFALYALQLWWLLRRLGRFGPSSAALYPLLLAFFLAAFGVAVARAATGRPSSWRGRPVPSRRT